MTQAEFAKGWKLLILQPWGWRYRSLTPQGQPSEESRTQLEFYYDKLKWSHPDAWFSVANRYAEGQEWPSVQSLRDALRYENGRYVKQIAEAIQPGVPPPPEVREILARIGVKEGEHVL